MAAGARRISFALSSRIAGPVVIAALLVAKVAVADTDPAMAEALFVEGKDLMRAGKLDVACPKLAESYRLDPGSGVLLAVAICHESQGRLATAWAEFKEAATLAQKDGRADRRDAANERVVALQARLPKHTIRVSAPTAALAGLEIKRNGVQVGPAAWGIALPIDPGEVTVEVNAPGKKPWTVHAPLAEGQSAIVDVPVLDDVPGVVTAPPPRREVVPEDAAPATATATQGMDTRTILGLGVGAAGLVAVGVGGVIGVGVLADAADVRSHCPGGTCSDPAWIGTHDRAGRSADLATVLISVGAVAVIVGAVLALPPLLQGGGPSKRPAEASTRWRNTW